MKVFFAVLGILLFAFLLPAEAQQSSSLDWDIDSLFNDPPEEPAGEKTEDKTNTTPISAVAQRGIVFNTAFQFIGGLAPGFSDAPWFGVEKNDFEWTPYLKMRADFGVDARISEGFRVNTVVYFEFPASDTINSFSSPYFSFKLDELFADFNIYKKIFFRAGKYNLSWGISPNFKFTDLLSRVPEGTTAFDSFIFKAEIPVGIGGFQFLALTRADLMNRDDIGWKDIGYGGKYNLALKIADFDWGVYYQESMNFRGFFSAKTTIVNTELYNEWLGSLNTKDPHDFSGAINVGFVQDFFNGKFSVNGELFYNAEGKAFWYQPETIIKDSEVSPFIEGFNIALNLLYRFDGKANFRLFVQTLYAPEQESIRLIPGFRIKPWSYMELYAAVPMALGSREGYYYKNTVDPKNRPFSVLIYLSLQGSVSGAIH